MALEHADLMVVLSGQPNTGKSTIFSLLTGLYQTVGNYPGVTVEKKSGFYTDGGRRIEVVDLPGTYSLTSYSQEERIARDFILLEHPEVLVVVVDASNLRRHFHLLLPLLELQVPTVVCLNMVDMAARWGVTIDIPLLEKELGTRVVPMVGSTGKGLDQLKRAILEVGESTHHREHRPTNWKLDYGPELNEVIDRLETQLASKKHLSEDFSARWLALKLLEEEQEAHRIVQHHTHDDGWSDLRKSANEITGAYEKRHARPIGDALLQARTAFANRVEAECIRRVTEHARGSDLLDRIAVHPILGLLLIALVMFSLFQLVFLLADTIPWCPAFAEDRSLEWVTPVAWLDTLFSAWLPNLLDHSLGLQDGLFRSFLFQGVIAGVGGVLTFVPLIFFMFLLLSVLERSGYVARVVVLLDRVLRRFGLHGQSVLPMALGGGIVGGCAVPAIMATRSMKEQRERLVTILVIPLMNCGAKIPVYAMLIGAFFSAYQGLVMTGLILLSWSIALGCAWCLGKTVVPGEPSPLIIELPPYRWPNPWAVLYTALLQSWWFMKKAGTIILAVNIVLWFLMSFPRMENVDEATRMEHSFAGRMGKSLLPVGQWAGFDWKDNIALLGGFAAKEVIVSTLATLHSIDPEEEETAPATGEEAVSNRPANLTDSPAPPEEEEDEEAIIERRLIAKLPGEPGWTPVKALAMIVFVMVYAPCMPTCAVIWRETGSFRWVAIAVLYTTSLAYLLAVSIFQVGRILF